MIINALLLSLLGFSALSLSLTRHRKEAWPTLPAWSTWKVRASRIFGFFCLGAAAVVCIKNGGWSRGLVYWCTLLALSGFALSLLLSYKPRRLPTALGSCALILCGNCIHLLTR